jgi:hypothetical protein
MPFNKTLLLSILTLSAVALTACGGTSATASPESLPEISEPTLAATIPAPTDPPAPVSSDTPLPQATEATTASTASVSFVNDVLPIFESRCINCHGGEQTKEGLDLKTYAALMAGSQNGSVITPGSAEDSYLAQQLLDGEMPKRGPKLTPNQVQVILDWINAGALDN